MNIIISIDYVIKEKRNVEKRIDYVIKEKRNAEKSEFWNKIETSKTILSSLGIGIGISSFHKNKAWQWFVHMWPNGCENYFPELLSFREKKRYRGMWMVIKECNSWLEHAP